jgi:hypothetical protein
MTRTERKLRKTLSQEIDDGKILIKHTRSVEIHVTDSDGDTDYDATDRLVEKVAKVLGWGGYMCGWGGWVLEKGCVSQRAFNTR